MSLKFLMSPFQSESGMGQDDGAYSFQDTDWLLRRSGRSDIPYSRLVSSQSVIFNNEEARVRLDANLIVSSICCQRFAN